MRNKVEKFDGSILKSLLDSKDFAGSQRAQDYLESKLIERIEMGSLRFNKKFNPKENASKIASLIVNEIQTGPLQYRSIDRGGFGGKEAFIDALKKNPYEVIMKASRIVRNSNRISEKFEQVLYVDNNHRLVREGRNFKRVAPTSEYLQGRNFYNNVIKGNGLNDKFHDMTDTGFGGSHVIKYDEFEQGYGEELTKTLDDRTIITGYVTKYKGKGGKDEYKENKDVFIVVWQSKGGNVDYGVEILTKNEYEALKNKKGYSSRKRIMHESVGRPRKK